MKRVIITALAVLVCTFSYAQFESPVKLDPQKKVQSHKKMVKDLSKDVRWFFPTWDLLDDFYMGSMDGATGHYANFVWPDSTVKVSSNGMAYNDLMSLGAVIDPYADWYGTNGAASPIPDNNVVSITLDSIFIMGWYNNVDGVFEDTLVFEIVVGQPQTSSAFKGIVNNNTGAEFSAPAIAGSTDLTGWKAMLTDPNKYVFKHVLTDADSTMDLGKIIQIPTNNISITHGEIVGINVTFVPGYSYNFGDTIFSYDTSEPTAYKNSMRIGLYGTDDVTANPDLFLDPYNDAGHFNGTYATFTETRYGTWPSSSPLNEGMYPPTDWGMDIGAFFDWTLGVDNLEAISMEIYPNPTSEKINISIEEYQNAKLQIYNLLGKIVKTADITAADTELNVASLNNGTYILRVVNGDKVAIKKIMINK